MLCPGSSPIRGDEGARRYVDAATDLHALELASAPALPRTPETPLTAFSIVGDPERQPGGHERSREPDAGRAAHASDSRTRVHGTGIPGGRAARRRSRVSGPFSGAGGRATATASCSC